jgi:HAD superfamily hydrolase (TIGR01509 family)
MTLLVFDCDGVLVDSELVAHGVLAELLTRLGRPITMDEALRTFSGRSRQDTIRLTGELLGRPIPEQDGALARTKMLDIFRRDLKPVAGIGEAIAALPYRRCVASSSDPERLHLSLDVTGLAPLFGDHVFSAAQVARGKPAPDLFLHAANEMKTFPRDCIVIEDSVLGVEAGIAAGMTVIGFAGAAHATEALAARLAQAGASAVIRQMADLPSVVQDAVKRK